MARTRTGHPIIWIIRARMIITPRDHFSRFEISICSRTCVQKNAHNCTPHVCTPRAASLPQIRHFYGGIFAGVYSVCSTACDSSVCICYRSAHIHGRVPYTHPSVMRWPVVLVSGFWFTISPPGGLKAGAPRSHADRGPQCADESCNGDGRFESLCSRTNFVKCPYSSVHPVDPSDGVRFLQCSFL